ncbi:MAG: methyltransferase domain-containing protein [Planctomycetes bacterium]|jgi:SAM-dependent methyltransferase|nr:methyltransferase domain-containing protein [Phycisphaerae bacterium]NBB96421.1 methyltransferase domain-containing protein [Planctomycetota bacterium]
MTALTSEQERIEHCQQQYRLTYHVPYAFTCDRMVGFAGKDVLEVGGSLCKDFVMSELQPNSWTGMEAPDYAEEVGDANPDGTGVQGQTLAALSTSERGFAALQLEPGSYSTFYANIEDLPDAHRGTYDLVFSIACFEHILRFPEALAAMHAALKPGGQLWTMFSPIWSAFDGHHLPAVTDAEGRTFDKKNSPIPPFGHLLMSPGQMYDYLMQHTDRQAAAEMVYYIYNSPHLNRYFTEDYATFVQRSAFEVVRIEGTFPVQLAPDGQRKLQTACRGHTQFANNGLLMLLSKAG